VLGEAFEASGPDQPVGCALQASSSAEVCRAPIAEMFPKHIFGNVLTCFDMLQKQAHVCPRIAAPAALATLP